MLRTGLLGQYDPKTGALTFKDSCPGPFASLGSGILRTKGDAQAEPRPRSTYFILFIFF